MGRPSASRPEALDALLDEFDLATKLDSWNSYTQAVQVPNDLATTMMTGRPELLRAVKPRALTVEETKAIYDCLATLIETNMALQHHAQQVAHLVDNWASGFKTLATVGNKIEHFANFRKLSDVAEDEEDGS